jgi:hypothetical protein
MGFDREKEKKGEDRLKRWCNEEMLSEELIFSAVKGSNNSVTEVFGDTAMGEAVKKKIV